MSSNAGWQGEPLPRGRHKLPVSTVRASQRERIVRAMLESVGRDGYEVTTVPRVVATARVSRNAFYEFFADKADCFIAACDEAAQELLAELVDLVSEPDWVQAMWRGARLANHLLSRAVARAFQATSLVIGARVRIIAEATGLYEKTHRLFNPGCFRSYPGLASGRSQDLRSGQIGLLR